jgi:hypothetical protein
MRLNSYNTDGLLLEGINLGRGSMRSDCLHRGIDALVCPTVYMDMRNFARKRLGNRKPDSCRRSRYQRDFPRKS